MTKCTTIDDLMVSVVSRVYVKICGRIRSNNSHTPDRLMHIGEMIEITKSLQPARKIRYVLLGRKNLEALEKSVAPQKNMASLSFFAAIPPTALGHRIVPVNLDDFAEVVYQDQIST